MSLSPTFDKDVISYTASTTNASNAVTATPEDSGATVVTKLNGAVVTSPVSWAEGSNTLEIDVTNGDVSKTYTVVVTKS